VKSKKREKNKRSKSQDSGRGEGKGGGKGVTGQLKENSVNISMSRVGKKGLVGRAEDRGGLSQVQEKNRG